MTKKEKLKGNINYKKLIDKELTQENDATRRRYSLYNERGRRVPYNAESGINSPMVLNPWNVVGIGLDYADDVTGMNNNPYITYTGSSFGRGGGGRMNIGRNNAIRINRNNKQNTFIPRTNRQTEYFRPKSNPNPTSASRIKQPENIRYNPPATKPIQGNDIINTSIIRENLLNPKTLSLKERMEAKINTAKQKANDVKRKIQQKIKDRRIKSEVESDVNTIPENTHINPNYREQPTSSNSTNTNTRNNTNNTRNNTASNNTTSNNNKSSFKKKFFKGVGVVGGITGGVSLISNIIDNTDNNNNKFYANTQYKSDYDLMNYNRSNNKQNNKLQQKNTNKVQPKQNKQVVQTKQQPKVTTKQQTSTNKVVQKQQPKSVQKYQQAKVVIDKKNPNIRYRINPKSNKKEVDLSKVGNFNQAFDEARKLGLKTFYYGSGKYNKYSTALETDKDKERRNREYGAKRIAKRPVFKCGGSIKHK